MMERSGVEALFFIQVKSQVGKVTDVDMEGSRKKQ